LVKLFTIEFMRWGFLTIADHRKRAKKLTGKTA
jgi:hypothetical protein